MIDMFNPQTVKLNSAGISVYILQAMLRGMQLTGADNKPLEIDGYAGENTIHAINEFQKMQIAYGYDCGTNNKPDSIFGEKCWNRLLGVKYARY